MVKIKLAGINNLDTIVKVLNKVTLHLHEKGVNQWNYPCNRSEIEMDIEKGYIYVLVRNLLIKMIKLILISRFCFSMLFQDRIIFFIWEN